MSAALSKLRGLDPIRVGGIFLLILATGFYAVTGGVSSHEPLDERIAHCLDDYFGGVTLDPSNPGTVGGKGQAGSIWVEDDQGDELEVAVERTAKDAAKVVGSLRPLSAERVGSAVFVYKGDSATEREVVARCATGKDGTESLIEKG